MRALLSSLISSVLLIALAGCGNHAHSAKPGSGESKPVNAKDKLAHNTRTITD